MESKAPTLGAVESILPVSKTCGMSIFLALEVMHNGSKRGLGEKYHVAGVFKGVHELVF